MMDISVIIPVYNTPLDSLEKCITSVMALKQKFSVEIIVIDDGSKKHIHDFFETKFIGEVVYKYKLNGGVSSARNMGLDIANGKFVCFVDADDIILEEAFLNLVNLTNYENYEMILFDMEVVENNYKEIWKTLDCNRGVVDKKTILIELLTSSRMNSPCAKLFSNECIKKNQIRFDENMITAEDMNFIVDFIVCSSRYYYTREVLYCYQRDDSTRIARVKRNPDTYYDNMNHLINRQAFIIEKYKMEEYTDRLVEARVNVAYNYLSDLMMLHLLTDARRVRVSRDIDTLCFNGAIASRKTTIKYKLIREKKWSVIRCVAFVRMLYLRFK